MFVIVVGRVELFHRRERYGCVYATDDSQIMQHDRMNKTGTTNIWFDMPNDWFGIYLENDENGYRLLHLWREQGAN